MSILANPSFLSQLGEINLTLSKIRLHIINLPQHEAFQSAIALRQSRRALIIEIVDQNGNVGYGECSARPDPYYSHEFLDACVQVVRDFIVPLLQQDYQQRFGHFYNQLTRIKGWHFTKNAVLDAFFNLFEAAKALHPITLSGRKQLERIPVGISLGLYASTDALLEKIEEANLLSYQRIKLKISPQSDVAQFRAVKQNFPDINLLLDANGTFLEQDFGTLKLLSDLKLTAIEQPFPADRFDLYQRLRQSIPGLRVCIDEGVEDYGHLVTAIRMQALDELNIKVGRIGDMVKALQIDAVCLEHGISTWVGGMFESGIGRTNNLRFASLFINANAHDLSPSSRYFPEDIVLKPIAMGKDGCIPTPDAPPLVDPERLAKYRVEYHEIELAK